MTVPESDSDRKAALREQIRARRRGRDDATRAEVSASLAVRLGLVPEVARLVADPASGCVAAYASHGTEPGTEKMRALLALAGVQVLLPVVGEAGGLSWGWDAGELAATGRSRGIPEPQGEAVGHGAHGLHALGCRVVLVPALAVDTDGNRLGKGGGYYDRLLSALASHPHTAPLLCALVHDDEVLEHPATVPAEPFDRPVDAVLTPSTYRRLAVDA